MKVLVISEYYPSKEKPYSGRYIKQQMDAFRTFGNEVDVLIPVRNSKMEFTKHDLPDNSYYQVGYRTDRYELFPGCMTNSFQASLRLLCREKQYDLIAVHLTSDTILHAVAAVSAKENIPFAQHYHGLNVWKEYVSAHPWRERIYASRRTRYLRKAGAVIGVSGKVSAVIAQKLPKEKVYTVYNGVDTSLFTPEVKQEKDTIKIVGVGRLIYTKGYHLLLEALSRICKEQANITLEIVGDGPEMDHLTQMVEQMGLQEVVTLSGRKDYDQVAQSMIESDLFVLPSYYEALGCVYLEAMACGLPAIGVAGMGVDEVIRDGENGYVVAPQSVEDLTSKLADFLQTSQEQKARMSRCAYETAQEYTWLKSAENLEKVYKKVLNQ